MASLDISNRKSNILLVHRITRLVSKYSNLPDKLIVTRRQFDYLITRKETEYYPATGEYPETALFHTPCNVMEIEVEPS